MKTIDFKTSATLLSIIMKTIDYNKTSSTLQSI